MKKIFKIGFMLAPMVLLTAATAFANKPGGGSARPDWYEYWEIAWRYLNFFLLAFLIVKFGKAPLMGFISGQRETLAAEIREMEEAKAQAEAEFQETQTKIDGLAKELDDFKAQLTGVAAKEREKMLEEARVEAESILERGKLQSEMALQHARREMTSELVKLAGDLAEEKLLALMTAEDQKRMFDEFTQAVSQRGSA